MFNLTSCEGFFTNNDLDQKIKDAIAYANAPVSSFFITADASAGTITPVGKISYKPTDYQNIKFKIKPEYEFIRWNFRYEEIQSGEKYTREITNPNWYKDYIDIVNEEISEPSTTGEITYTLQIQFKKPEENMLIEPVCALKPVLKSWSGQLGEIQSRNGSLSFVFNTKLDLDKSIYFSDAELDECAVDEETGELVQITPLFNGQNPARVYGYVKNGETYFKNIEIKYKNRSINSSYKDFRWNNETNTLIIASDPTHSYDIIGDFADIEVLFKEGIKSEAQASMNESKAFINVNKYSDERSVITVVTNTAKNPETVSPVTQALYLQEQKSVTFIESDGIQFLYWEVTSNSAYPESKAKVYTEADEENPRKLNYWGMQKIDSTEEATISAVYEFRPKILSYTPNAQTVAPKDSDIQINFDEEINLASFIAGYKISCGGDPVQDYFDEPVLSADKKSVIIAAKLDKRLLIDSNKQVTVTVPATVYYEKTESDGKTYQITLGQEKQLAYTVEPKTKDKAYIQFNVDTNKVTIDNFNTNGVKNWSIGDTQTIVCNENSGYQFLGWVKNNDANNAIEVIKVDDSTYTFKVNQACGLDSAPIVINANAKERLSASLFSPSMNNQGVAKDNDIIIDFNHKPELADCKEYITVLYNNINLNESSFLADNWQELEETTVSGKTVYRLTIPANKEERLEISGIANIEIRIDDDLSYTDGTDKVYYKPKGDAFKYKINNSTKDKAYVQFEITNGHGTVKSGGSNFNISSVKTYNIGDEVTLTFEEETNYQFFGWTKTGDNDDAIQLVKSDLNSKMYTFRFTEKVGTEDSPVQITAKTIERLRVNKITPAMNDAGVEKDRPISVYFNHPPVLEICKQKIAIQCNGINVKSSFPTDGWTINNIPVNDGYLLSIPADTVNRLNINAVSTITITFDSNLYYIDGTDLVYYGGEGYSYDYKVKDETFNKASLTFSVTQGQGSMASGEDGDYSLGKRLAISFDENEDYEFLYWSTNNTNAISFDDEYQKNTNITIDNTGPAVIQPVCAPKLKIVSFLVNGTTNPANTNDSFSKDSFFIIKFNEAPQRTNYSRYIKVLRDGVNLYPRYYTVLFTSDGKSMQIKPYSNPRLSITSEETITVAIDSSWYYAHSSGANITLKETFEQDVKLNGTTTTKIPITIENCTESNAGTITNKTQGSSVAVGENSCSLDEEFSLHFEPTEDYEFIEWDISYSGGSSTNQNIEYSDISNQTLNVTVKAAYSGTVTIKPVVAEKLAVTSVTVDTTFTDEPLDVSLAYPKDTIINLYFNQPLPSTQNLREKLSIIYNGRDVKDKYLINTDKTNSKKLILKPYERIDTKDIVAGQALEITVNQSLYYNYSSERTITLASDKKVSVKLRADTVSHAYVQIVAPDLANSGSISLTDDSLGNTLTTAKTAYSLDETFKLKFTPNPGYEFIKWEKIAVGEDTGVIVDVDIKDENSASTTVEILYSVGYYNNYTQIKPVVVEKLAVQNVEIQNGSTTIVPQNGVNYSYPKDCNVIITFNYQPSNVENVLDNIIFTCNGQIVTGFFTVDLPEDSNTVIFTANQDNRIPLSGTSALFNVTVKKGLYYSYDTTKDVYPEQQYEKSWTINNTTQQKAKVDITCDSDSIKGIIYNADTSVFTPREDLMYSKDEVINLKFIPDDDYEFVYWKVTGTNTSCPHNVEIEYPESTDTKITITNSFDGTVTIEPVCEEHLKITSVTINNKPYYPVTVYEKDSPVIITFNKKLTPGVNTDITDFSGYVKMYFKEKTDNGLISANGTSNYFALSHGNSTGVSKIYLQPNQNKFLDVQSTDLVFLTVNKNMFYYSQSYIVNGKTKRKQIFMSNSYDEYYQVSYESVKKFEISKAIYEHTSSGVTELGSSSEAASLITIKPERENGLYNYGEKITVSFPWDSQSYYKVFDDGTNTDMQKKGWLLRKYNPDNNGSSVTGKILSTDNTNGYYRATFQIFSARTNSNSSEAVPQTMKLCYNVAAKPELKSIEPMTTMEAQTFTCDTPIIMNFTHPVDKSSVHFGSLDYQGNDYLENNLWICVPVDENGKYVPNGKIWDGFRDITEYYHLDTTEGGDKSLVIRPKVTLLNLFQDLGTEEITVYLMIDECYKGGNKIITSSEKPLNVSSSSEYYALNTAYKWFIYDVPAQLNDKIGTKEMRDFFNGDSDKIKEAFKFATMGEDYYNTQFWFVPLTISSSISNPRMQVSSMTVKFSDKSSNVSENVRLNTLDDLNANKKAISNQSMYVYITPDEDVRGNWSSEDFTIPVYVDIEVTQYTSYNKSTQTITNPAVFAVNNGMAVTYKAGTNFTLNPYGGYLGSGMITEVIKFSNFGFSTTDPTNYAVLQMNIKVSSPIYQYPFQKTYYVLYGAL